MKPPWDTRCRTCAVILLDSGTTHRVAGTSPTLSAPQETSATAFPRPVSVHGRRTSAAVTSTTPCAFKPPAGRGLSTTSLGADVGDSDPCSKRAVGSTAPSESSPASRRGVSASAVALLHTDLTAFTTSLRLKLWTLPADP
eukprot:scaffold60268_cov27-Tisochrysis_lutea.AAC.15